MIEIKEFNVRKLVFMVIFALAAAMLPASPWAGDYGGGSTSGGYRVGYNRGSSTPQYSVGYNRGGGGSPQYRVGYNRGSYGHGGNGYGHGNYSGGGKNPYVGGHGYKNSGHNGYGNYYSRNGHGGGRTYRYAVGYRDGGGGYPFNFYRHGYNTNNGYTGDRGPDNRMHRASYEGYLRRINSEARSGENTLSTAYVDAASIEPAAGPGNNLPRVQQAVSRVCGNWQRADDACRSSRATTQWQPWMAMYE